MTIHILNSLNISPYLTFIKGGVTFLLVETNQGPVLVDTGIGRRDHLHPSRRMRYYKYLYSASKGLERTAFHLIQKLGYRPQDIRHIVLSHLHLDHAGGLSDFPWAKVHIYNKEYKHVMARPNWKYEPAHWAHKPDWMPHKLIGEKWFDFNAIRLKGFEPELWLIPLPGHSPGHAGVAIRDGDGWILYGGDALPYNARVELVPRWFARYFMYHHAPRIREFVSAHPEVHLVAGHMALGFYEND